MSEALKGALAAVDQWFGADTAEEVATSEEDEVATLDEATSSEEDGAAALDEAATLLELPELPEPPFT